MSVSGVGGGSAFRDPSRVETASSSSAPATTPGTLDYGPFAGVELFRDILNGGATLAMGAEGPEVRVLEETLIALGYGLPGRGQPNHRLTIGTVNALTRFQNDHGLTPTGQLDAATLKALDDVAASRLASTQPAAPAEPKPTDFVPKAVLERYGLSTDKMTTESHYEGEEWGSVGYYPYDGDVQYVAFAKHKAVFGGDAGADAHGYFEMYSNPPSGLRPGSWIADGYIRESDFEASAGVDVTGSRPIDNAAYKLLREAGAPQGSKFALRTADGKQIPVKEGDRLVPTVMRDGKPVEVEVNGDGNYSDKNGASLGWGADVVWRIKRGATVLYAPEHKAESRATLTGTENGVKFDFLDARGRLVGFDPSRDRIVETWKDGEKWPRVEHNGEEVPLDVYTETVQVGLLAKQDDGSFEHQVIENGRISSSERVDAARAAELKKGKDVIYRVQSRASGALKGDGKVSDRFNMGWWGKCHNVASLSTSNMPKPEHEVTVITNLGEGDEAGLRWGNNVLVPRRGNDGAITGYTHQVRGGDGSIESATEISVEQARGLASAHGARPVVVKADGRLEEAQTTRFDTESLTALVAHIGNGAVEYVGGAGERYYARPDVLVKKDGTQIEAHIKAVKFEDGKTETIGRRSGAEFAEVSRDALRSPGMTSRKITDGTGRRYAFNINTFDNINKYRESQGKKKISELVLLNPDGTEQTVKADEIEIFGWENKFDFRPDEVWGLHKTVTKDSSTVIETYTGTQVWNYAATDVETTVLDPSKLSAAERKEAAKPGMMTGSTEERGKVYFESVIETDGGTKRMRYWVRFDENGDVADYRYLNEQVPDFVWTQHVKKGKRWTGESQAPGVMNGDIQRLYFASSGKLSKFMLPGGLITAGDLKTAPAQE